MQARLTQIQDFIQAFVNAIASILNLEVTVVDHQLYRIAATAKYPDIGQKIQHASFFQQIIADKKSAMIRNAAASPICQQCSDRSHCNECATIAYPIFYHDAVCGVISIAAFTPAQRQRFTLNQAKFTPFLKYMSMLIESKMMTLQHSQELEVQLDEVISLSQKSFSRDRFIGQSADIKQLLMLAGKISDSSASVLITGESGTGKEVLANIIHNHSDRRHKLMITVNCAAIPESLFESELFGYEAGAFTGANPKGHIGKFELANNSTLFLDEISEMPLALQAKLLRVIQERKVTRLGSNHTVAINTRIICASNQNLHDMVANKQFRMDLYYRINVIPMFIPPLRKRVEDIPLLTHALMADYNRKLRKSVTLSPPALTALMQYAWPGNVRELKNLIEYLLNIKDNQPIVLADLPSHIVLPTATLKANTGEVYHLKNLLFDYEKQILQHVLKHAGSTEEKKQVAQKLGIGLSTLYKKMDQFSLDG